MSGFVKVGVVEDFPEGRGRAVSMPREKVAVFRVGRRWFALQDRCPHMGASLADGKLNGERIVCHWHGWTFELASGQGDARQWACARVYEVRVDNGEVFLKPPPTKAPAESGREGEAWIKWDPDRYFKKKP